MHIGMGNRKYVPAVRARRQKLEFASELSESFRCPSLASLKNFSGDFQSNMDKIEQLILDWHRSEWTTRDGHAILFVWILCRNIRNIYHRDYDCGPNLLECAQNLNFLMDLCRKVDFFIQFFNGGFNWNPLTNTVSNPESIV